MRAALILVLCLSLSPMAYGIDIYCGVLVHDVAPLRGHERKEGGLDLNGEFRFSSWLLQPTVGISINSVGDTSRVYAGVSSEYRRGALFVGLGLGGAVHTGELVSDIKRSLGSRILFRLAFELGFMLNKQHGISAILEHVSNAKLAWPNNGMDTLGIRYIFRY